MRNSIQESDTCQYKVVFPTTLNDQETLFGGEALKWMDEVAYIAAIRFTRKKMVTVSTDKIKFLKPIKPGSIVQIIGRILKVGSVKIDVMVDIYMEDMFSDKREKVVNGLFTFAAINNNNKPIAIS